MVRDYQQKQNALVVLSIVLTTTSIFIVLVRSFIRYFIIRKPSYDDYSIILALIFNIGYMAEVLVAKASHVGFPAPMLTAENMVSLLKDALAIEVTYWIILGFIKISILCTYLRFAVTEIFRHLCYWTIAFQFVFTVASVCVTLGQCRPMSKQWDATGTKEGSCINATAFFYTISGVNIVTDLWIIVLPIKTLRGINRPWREKMALILVFGAGLFAITMSAVRLRSIYTYTLATDPFRDAISVNIWSVIEVNVAILCASVPALKPIFTPHCIRDRRRKNQYRYRGRDESSYGGNSSHKGQMSRGASNVTGRADLQHVLDLSVLSPLERSGTDMETSFRNNTDDIVDGDDRTGEPSTAGDSDV